MTGTFEVTQEIQTFLVSAFHEVSHLPLIPLYISQRVLSAGKRLYIKAFHARLRICFHHTAGWATKLI